MRKTPFILPCPLTLPVVDLSELEPARRDAELRRQTSAAARAVFDLTRPPPLRATLFRLAGVRKVVV